MALRTTVFLLSGCIAALYAASPLAAADSAGWRKNTGVRQSLFTDAKTVSDLLRKGKTYSFRSVLLKKNGTPVRLEITSPLPETAAATWVKRRLEVYYQLINPARLDYGAAVERDVDIAEKYKGGIIAPGGGCPGYKMAFFPAGKDLQPVTSASIRPEYMGAAGFFYSKPSGTLTEAVIYFPAESFSRERVAADFAGAFCP